LECIGRFGKGDEHHCSAGIWGDRQDLRRSIGWGNQNGGKISKVRKGQKSEIEGVLCPKVLMIVGRNADMEARAQLRPK